MAANDEFAVILHLMERVDGLYRRAMPFLIVKTNYHMLIEEGELHEKLRARFDRPTILLSRARQFVKSAQSHLAQLHPEQMSTEELRAFAHALGEGLGSIPHENLQDYVQDVKNAVMKHDVQEVQKILADVQRWMIVSLGSGSRDIKPYLHKLNIYAHGGVMDGEIYNGLLQVGKKELLRQIVRSPQIKNFRTYQQQLAFFYEALNNVNELLMDNKEAWDKFMGKTGWFGREGKNLKSKMKKDFAHATFAQEMLQAIDSIGESPQGWKMFLDRITTRLSHPSYFNMAILAPAQSTIVRILEEELNKSSDRKASAPIEKIMNEVGRELESYEKKMNEHLSGLRAQFRTQDNQVVRFAQWLEILIDVGNRLELAPKKRQEQVRSVISRRIQMLNQLYSSVQSGNVSSREIYLEFQQGKLAQEESELERAPLPSDDIEARVKALKEVFEKELAPYMQRVIAFIQKTEGRFVVEQEGQFIPLSRYQRFLLLPPDGKEGTRGNVGKIIAFPKGRLPQQPTIQYQTAPVRRAA